MSAAVRQRCALVAFCDGGGLKWLRPLRRGFRHCFVLVAGETGWIALDPLADRIELTALPPWPIEDLAAAYRARGCTVVTVAVRRPPGITVPGLLTCVGAVKHAIGVTAPWVLTPWQLYRYLTAPPSRHRERSEATQGLRPPPLRAALPGARATRRCRAALGRFVATLLAMAGRRC